MLIIDIIKKCMHYQNCKENIINYKLHRLLLKNGQHFQNNKRNCCKQNVYSRNNNIIKYNKIFKIGLKYISVNYYNMRNRDNWID